MDFDSPPLNGPKDEALANWWHLILGEPPVLPLRSEDPSLPTFLRALDGPSGFARTRMPQFSEYLDWAASMLEDPNELEVEEVNITIHIANGTKLIIWDEIIDI